MNLKTIKKQLKQEGKREVPDCRDLVYSAVGYTPVHTIKPRKLRPLFYLPVLSVLLLVCVLSFMQKSYHNFIWLSETPSIELETNEKNKLVSIRPLNKEGLLILKCQTEDLLSFSLLQTSEQIIKTMLDLEYLSKNSILDVTVINEAKQETETEMQAEFTKKLSTSSILLDNEITIHQTQYSSTTSKLAKAYHVTKGKMKLVEGVAQKASTTSLQTLCQYNISTLNELFTGYQFEEMNQLSREYDSFMEEFQSEKESYYSSLYETYQTLKNMLSILIVSCNETKVNFKEINGLFDYMKGYCFQEYEDRIIDETNLDQFIILFKASDQKIDLLLQVNLSIFKEKYTLQEGFMKNVIKYQLEDGKMDYESSTFEYYPCFNTSIIDASEPSVYEKLVIQMEKINCLIRMFENSINNQSDFYLENLQDLKNTYEEIENNKEKYSELIILKQYFELKENYFKFF